MKLFLFALCLSFSFGAQAGNINTDLLVGKWEATHISQDGQVAAIKDLEFEDGEGFPIYELTEQNEFIIHANYEISEKFKVEGDKIITLDEDGTVISDYQVTLLNANTLRWKATDETVSITFKRVN